MANITQDTRVVKVNITYAELKTLLATVATDAALLDFTPDRITLEQSDSSLVVQFEKDTVLP
jgi:hypothetical protein